MAHEIDRGAHRRDAPPILQNAFRPFFLGGAIWAAIRVPIWYAEYSGYLGYAAGPAGHAHEMLYGVLAAIICGFALTAIANWTGRSPVAGAGLAALFVLWLAGRMAMLFSGEGWAIAIDLAFLPVFTLVVWREIIAGRNWRNLPVAVMVALFTLSHFAFHWPQGSGPATRMTLAVTALLVALIGGRIVPSFTLNWLAGRNDTAAKRTAPPMQGLDKLVLLLTGLALVLWILRPESLLTGSALGIAALGHLIRLSRWQGHRTLGEPLMWSLHAGYFWMFLALAIMAGAIVWPERVPAAAGLHAIGAGVIGGMTLAVMTRASLGHTGRERIAGLATTLVFVLVHVGAALRVLAAILSNEPRLLGVSAILWSAAFGVFALAYTPVLLGAKRTGDR